MKGWTNRVREMNQTFMVCQSWEMERCVFWMIGFWSDYSELTRVAMKIVRWTSELARSAAILYQDSGNDVRLKWVNRTFCNRMDFYCACIYYYSTALAKLSDGSGVSFDKWPNKFVMNLRRMTGMTMKENEGRDGQIGWEKWIKRSYVSVLRGGKVCVLNDRHFSPIIQNLHVGRWRLFGERVN